MPNAMKVNCKDLCGPMLPGQNYCGLAARLCRDLLLRAPIVLTKENRGKAEAMRRSTTGFVTNTQTMPQICAWMSRSAMFHCLD
jgi:hypothetical protein